MRILLAILALLTATPALAGDWQALLKANKPAEAFAEVEKAARKGDATSLDTLATFYDEGIGTTADPAKAADLYRQAADKGSAHAQWRLGVLLDSGTNPDPAASVALFEKSMKQGYGAAFVSMGVMYSNGRGVTKDYAKALAAYQEGGRRGNVHAFNEIAVVYYNGEGVTKSLDEAIAYWLVAASGGSDVAKKSLGALGPSLTDDQKTKAVTRAKAIALEYKLPGAETPAPAATPAPPAAK